MLPDYMNQCDLCKKDFSKYEDFTIMTVTFDKEDGKSGRYIKKRLCSKCFQLLTDELDRSPHFHKETES